MIPPEKLAGNDTEDGHQMAVIQWAALNMHQYPQLRWLHSIPNGAAFGNDKRTGAIRAAKMKATGMKPGVFDLFLPHANCGYHGLYIEMKRPKTANQTAGKVSDNQKDFYEYAMTNGYYPVYCYSWIEAVDILTKYMDGEL